MPLTATEINDASIGAATRLTRSSASVRGQRFFTVASRDPYLAITAVNIPSLVDPAMGLGGDPFDPFSPLVLARKLSTRAVGGDSSIVRVDYSDQSTEFAGPEPKPDPLAITTRTEIQTSLGSLSVVTEPPLTPGGGPGPEIPAPPATISVGRAAVIVTRLTPSVAAGQILSNWIAKVGMLNDVALTVPAVFPAQGVSQIVFAAKTVLLESLQQRVIDGGAQVIESQIRFLVASEATTWRSLRVRFGEQRDGAGKLSEIGRQTLDVYQTTDLSVLVN